MSWAFCIKLVQRLIPKEIPQGGTLLGLDRDNGKESGSYYSVLGVYWGYIRVILGTCLSGFAYRISSQYKIACGHT